MFGYASRVLHARRERRHNRKLARIYEKFQGYTMVKRQRYLDNLRLAQHQASVPGCIIECGTWRGGMIAGIADMLGPERDYVLFDSYEGLPPAQPIDGQAALDYQADRDGPEYHDNCTASIKSARQAMALSCARRYEIKKGWFEETLPGFAPPEPIALLRLDADWFESTLTCLEHLFVHLAPQGLVIMDDYYTWDGCSKAVHHFLAQTQSPARITQHYGICVISNP